MAVVGGHLVQANFQWILGCGPRNLIMLVATTPLEWWPVIPPVRVLEEWRGTRGGTYVYVAEGGELVHIGRYAVGEPIRDSYRVTYMVGAGKVSGKTLYCFSFTRGENGFVEKCRVWDFRGGRKGLNPWMLQDWT